MEDWFDRQDELEPGQIFRDDNGGIIKLDHRVPGDGTDWRVLDWDNGWFNYERRVHPSELAEMLTGASDSFLAAGIRPEKAI